VTLLFSFLRVLLDAFTLAIFLRTILSWIAPASTNTLVYILYKVTEPILAPLRRIIPRIGMLDFSPLVAIILLQLIAFLLP
jgi:YggT family protein